MKKEVFKWVVTVITAVWFVLMTLLSHQPLEPSGKLSKAINAIVQTVLPPDESSGSTGGGTGNAVTGGAAGAAGATAEEPSGWSVFWRTGFRDIRQWAHLMLFLVLAVLLTLTLYLWGKGFRNTPILLVIWSAYDEVLKPLSSGRRHCDWEDILRNLLGSIVGFLLTAGLILLCVRLAARCGEHTKTEEKQDGTDQGNKMPD